MTIIAPQRGVPLTDEKQIPSLRFASFLEDLSREVNTLTGNEDEYTTTNVTADRVLDADATTLNELADVVGTMIADLKAAGVIP